MTGMRSYGDPCGVACGLDIIGERWALLIVRDLLLGPKRFGDLHAGLPGISPNVLTQRLRELTEHGVVERRDLPPPARVRLYGLTDWGRALEPVLLHLGRWGSQAPAVPDGRLGVDSILLSAKAAFDPARVAVSDRVYELRIDADTYCVEITGGSLHISRGTAPSAPDATLATDLDTLRAICDHRLTLAAAVDSGSLRLDGPEHARQGLADLLLAPFDHAPSS
ncbi:winged helix-turn-helix transcriptional regulator [Saccharothrix coeruleofusca]|uniref:Transcriptional regulator n=1 Tax=Saccharothrix coeruleofusca TaxID=33919 RepID=A0A918AKV1_9PSEU|nr:winged helix-turn-helix transcriptional regulator [Saccharothrix coeruleofusca]MBP2338148.1 DNA-binding HxlR family transcriptional regulator/putative sterol carrier protein [Saccharothrix coeruleofusca]GGP50444.1 transcriptional regulator [Saccharothrix coeruleofusca]